MTPFLPVFAIWVLRITYVPFITVDVAAYLGRREKDITMNVLDPFKILIDRLVTV